MSLPEIEAEIKKMDNESKAFRTEIFKLAWFMRGSVDLEQAFMLDYQDREIIGKIIEDNLETTKKSGLNFF